MRRVIWIVLDSVGIGALPDADKFGDAGTNTIEHVWEFNKGLNIPNLLSFGYGNIEGNKVLPVCDKPVAAYGKLGELSNGKDTTAGHWEMTGVVSLKPFPTYPDGFPKEIIDAFVAGEKFDRVLGNCVASGTEIIKEHAEEHISTGVPIVYTSADSVFQIAYFVGMDSDPNTTDENKLSKLYELCEKARGILKGEHEISRVIARPFIGVEGNYVRTSDRRDYAILPPEHNLLNCLKNQNFDVIAVGKIEDIFAGSGITEATHTKNNMNGVDVTLDYMKKDNHGLIFTNLVDFDSSWGHRRDAAGYGKGLEEFDARLPELVAAMKDEDILIINADHGCDPTHSGSDHTREYIPVFIYGKGVKSVNLGVRSGFCDIGQTVAEYLGAKPIENGISFWKEISL